METKDGQFVPMQGVDVRRGKAEGTRPSAHVVLLQEVGGTQRYLPIWMGSFEATSIALGIERVALPRPGAYQFAAALFDAAGGGIREVRISKVVEKTIYAEVVVEGSAGTRVVDARPSDAINIALLTGAPIKANTTICEALQPSTPETFSQQYPDGPKELVAEVARQMRSGQ